MPWKIDRFSLLFFFFPLTMLSKSKLFFRIEFEIMNWNHHQMRFRLNDNIFYTLRTRLLYATYNIGISWKVSSAHLVLGLLVFPGITEWSLESMSNRNNCFGFSLLMKECVTKVHYPRHFIIQNLPTIPFYTLLVSSYQ